MVCVNTHVRMGVNYWYEFLLWSLLVVFYDIWVSPCPVAIVADEYDKHGLQWANSNPADHTGVVTVTSDPCPLQDVLRCPVWYHRSWTSFLKCLKSARVTILICKETKLLLGSIYQKLPRSLYHKILASRTMASVCVCSGEVIFKHIATADWCLCPSPWLFRKRERHLRQIHVDVSVDSGNWIHPSFHFQIITSFQVYQQHRHWRRI